MNASGSRAATTLTCLWKLEKVQPQLSPLELLVTRIRDNFPYCCNRKSRLRFLFLAPSILEGSKRITHHGAPEFYGFQGKQRGFRLALAPHVLEGIIACGLANMIHLRIESSGVV